MMVLRLGIKPKTLPASQNISRRKLSPYHADLDTPMLDIGGEVLTARNLVESALILGGTGAGKSSSSGRIIANAYLTAGWGGVVLCAKTGEADRWRAYAKAAGRLTDLVVIDATGRHRFNILDYAVEALGGQGFEQNLLSVMSMMIEATRIAAGESGGGGKSERYFTDNAMQWMAHAFPILLVTEGSIRLGDLYRLLTTCAKDMQEASSDEWLRSSYCAEVHHRLHQVATKAGPDSYAATVAREHGDFFLTTLPKLDNRPRSSIESTLTSMIYPFLSGKLAELFCTGSTVTPDECRDGKIILLDLPVHRYGPTGAVAQSLFKYLFGVAAQNTVVTDTTRPIFCFADEWQFFISPKNDAELLSTARDYKASCLFITQDLPTIYARCGGSDARDQAEAIVSKFGLRLFHASTSRETNQYAADIIVKVLKFHVTTSLTRGRTAGLGGGHGDANSDHNAHSGVNAGTSQSTSGYLDYDIPPHYFSSELRNGTAKNRFVVDAIVLCNARKWKKTGKHWVKAEFSQK